MEKLPEDKDNIEVVVAGVESTLYDSLIKYCENNETKKINVVARFKTDFTVADVVTPIKANRTRILLLGDDLPGIDGISIAEAMKSEGLSENIIMVSWFYSPLQKKLISELEVGYCFCMPVEVSRLCRRIEDCSIMIREKLHAFSELKRCENIDLKGKTTRILHEIGVPANLCGHEYLRDAIMMIADGGEVYGKMTKVIYPTIAARYNKSAPSVEKAIRTALETAWIRGKVDLLNDIFGFTVNVHKGKPTNSEFIALLADYIVSCG